MGSKVSSVSFFSILASELNDRCLAEFLAMDSSLVVSFHLQAIDQTAAIKDIKHKLTALDQMKIDEQKKAVRAGYDMEILPSDLAAWTQVGGEILPVEVGVMDGSGTQHGISVLMIDNLYQDFIFSHKLTSCC